MQRLLGVIMLGACLVLGSCRHSTPPSRDKGNWTPSDHYNYRGWTLARVPHSSLTIPVDVPHAASFHLVDIVPDGVTSVRVEAIGFRLGSFTVNAYDGEVEDYSTDNAFLNTAFFHDGVGARSKAIGGTGGIADVTIRFTKPKDAESTGLVDFSMYPHDTKAPLKGSLRFTYLTEGR